MIHVVASDFNPGLGLGNGKGENIRVIPAYRRQAYFNGEGENMRSLTIQPSIHQFFNPHFELIKWSSPSNPCDPNVELETLNF